MADRPLRADAQRNRRRLLEVAGQVFAERGTAVPTEEIARAAGVGVGTLFRHFPTKEALLRAVYLARMAEVGALAEELADAADPGAAFVEFFTALVRGSAGKSVLMSALAQAGIDPKEVTDGIREQFHDRLGVLLRRAADAGAVRADLEVPDVIALLLGLAALAEQPTVGAAAAERALDVVLAGLRPGQTG